MQRLHEWKADVVTLRGLPTIIGYGAEVSRGHSKPATSCNPNSRAIAEDSRKDEGLNVRIGDGIRKFMWQATTTETRKRTNCVRISRKLKQNTEGVEPEHATNENNAG